MLVYATLMSSPKLVDSSLTKLEPLLGSTLVLVAHPDDESIGCGVLLQRIERASILVCTDGAPATGRRWHSLLTNKRNRYALRRQAEFCAAADIVGVRHRKMLSGIQDQSLYKSLERAAMLIGQYIEERKPGAILSHAFEGGHPDHDSCALLANWAGRQFALPVWEMPMYFRLSPSAPLVYQRFLHETGREITLCPAPDEIRIKQLMLSQHRSQAVVISKFNWTLESFRPQAEYNFAINPTPALSTFAVCNNVSFASVLESFRAFRSTPDGRRSQNAVSE